MGFENRPLSSTIPFDLMDSLTTSSPVHKNFIFGSIFFASVFKYLLSIKLPLAKLLQYTVGQTHKSFAGILKLETSSRISRCLVANPSSLLWSISSKKMANSSKPSLLACLILIAKNLR